MRVLITGGLGFIGSHIAMRLRDSGHPVTVVDNMLSSVADEIPGVDVVRADLSDGHAVESLPIPPADCVMHLAGPSSGMASAKDPVGTVATAYRVTLNALAVAARAGAARFLNASSMVVYGMIPAESNPVREDTPCLPVSHYAVAKFATERLVEIACRQQGASFAQVRMFNVYGPGQDLTRMDQGLVSIFLAMLLKSPKVVSKGSLDRFRDVVHIDDVVNSWIRIAEKNVDGPVNIGCGEAVTYRRLIEILADELGLKDRLECVTAEGTPGDLFGICADISRLREVFGVSPRYRPEDGIRAFARWAQSRQSGKD
jgi:UDP-glucose 4-epimerase